MSVSTFVPNHPNSTDANELSRWIGEHFEPISKNIDKIQLNRETIARAVRTMFQHRDDDIINKYNARRLVTVVDNEQWEFLPEALESFDTTWS